MRRAFTEGPGRGLAGRPNTRAIGAGFRFFCLIGRFLGMGISTRTLRAAVVGQVS
jgi:hypothetical protein